MARRVKIRPISWAVVQIAMREGRKITRADPAEAKRGDWAGMEAALTKLIRK